MPNLTLFWYEAVLTIGCVSYLWAKFVKFLNHFSLFFQKTRIKYCFKLSIPDFDICLNWPTMTNSEKVSEPDFYSDLVYKLKKIVGSNNFSAQFIKIISHYKKIGYNINVLQQTACLVVNPITVSNFAFLFNCTPVGRNADSMMVPT